MRHNSIFYHAVEKQFYFRIASFDLFTNYLASTFLFRRLFCLTLLQAAFENIDICFHKPQSD